MPHQIEMYGQNAAFASARLDAWHRLGVVTDSAMNAREALEAAHLADWNVRKEALQVSLGNGGLPLDVDSAFATVRTNPWNKKPEVLGTVGKLYRPIQNEEHCELLDTLVDESGAHFETAGSLRGGREVFITMKLPEHMSVGGIDDLDMYIAALNSHDGSGSFRFLVTPVRIVCANTQSMAIDAARSTFSIRHTSSAQGRIEQARQALDLTFKYQEGFQKEAEHMINQQMSDAQFNAMIRQLFNEPAPEATSAAHRRYSDLLDRLNWLFWEAETNDAIRGTCWAGYQAVVEYIDHYKPSKGNQWFDDAASARAQSSLSSAAASLKQKAYKFAGA